MSGNLPVPHVDAFKCPHYKTVLVVQLTLLSNKIKWGEECIFWVTEILQAPLARYKRDAKHTYSGKPWCMVIPNRRNYVKGSFSQ